MIKVNDIFILHSDNGMDYNITVVNINEFREPNMKYACEVIDGNGVAFDDFMFVGDEFFNSKKVERVVKE
jgi:hypothetical protein